MAGFTHQPEEKRQAKSPSTKLRQKGQCISKDNKAQERLTSLGHSKEKTEAKTKESKRKTSQNGQWALEVEDWSDGSSLDDLEDLLQREILEREPTFDLRTFLNQKAASKGIHKKRDSNNVLPNRAGNNSGCYDSYGSTGHSRVPESARNLKDNNNGVIYGNFTGTTGPMTPSTRATLQTHLGSSVSSSHRSHWETGYSSKTRERLSQFEDNVDTMTSSYGKNTSRNKLHTANTHLNRNHYDNTFGVTQYAKKYCTTQSGRNGEAAFGTRNDEASFGTRNGNDAKSSKLIAASEDAYYERRSSGNSQRAYEMPKSLNKENYQDEKPSPLSTGLSTSKTSMGLAQEGLGKYCTQAICECTSNKETVHRSEVSRFSVPESDHLARQCRTPNYRSWSKKKGSSSLYQHKWPRKTRSLPCRSSRSRSRSREFMPVKSEVRRSEARRSTSRESLSNGSRSQESASSSHVSLPVRSRSCESTSTSRSWESVSSCSGSCESIHSTSTSCISIPSGSGTRRSSQKSYSGPWKSRLSTPRSRDSHSVAPEYYQQNCGLRQELNRGRGMQTKHSHHTNKSSRLSKETRNIISQICTAMKIYRYIMLNKRKTTQYLRRGKGCRNGRILFRNEEHAEGYGRWNSSKKVSSDGFQRTQELMRKAHIADNIKDSCYEKLKTQSDDIRSAEKYMNFNEQKDNHQVPRTELVHCSYGEGPAGTEESVFGMKHLLFSPQEKYGKVITDIHDFIEKMRIQSASISDTGKSFSHEEHEEDNQVPETDSVNNMFVEGTSAEERNSSVLRDTICFQFPDEDEEHPVSATTKPANGNKEQTSNVAPDDNECVSVSTFELECRQSVSTERPDVEIPMVESDSDVSLPDLEDDTVRVCWKGNHDAVDKSERNTPAESGTPPESQSDFCPPVPPEPEIVRLAEETVCSVEGDVNQLPNDTITPANMSVGLENLDVHQLTDNAVEYTENNSERCDVRPLPCDDTHTTQGPSSDCLISDYINKSFTMNASEEESSYIDERIAILNKKEIETIMALISFKESHDNSQEKAATNLCHFPGTESSEEENDCISHDSFPLFESDDCDSFTRNETQKYNVSKGINNDIRMLTSQGGKTKERLSKINISDELKLTEKPPNTKNEVAIRKCSVVLKDIKKTLNTRPPAKDMTENQHVACKGRTEDLPSFNKHSSLTPEDANCSTGNKIFYSSKVVNKRRKQRAKKEKQIRVNQPELRELDDIRGECRVCADRLLPDQYTTVNLSSGRVIMRCSGCQSYTEMADPFQCVSTLQIRLSRLSEKDLSTLLKRFPSEALMEVGEQWQQTEGTTRKGNTRRPTNMEHITESTSVTQPQTTRRRKRRRAYVNRKRSCLKNNRDKGPGVATKSKSIQSSNWTFRSRRRLYKYPRGRNGANVIRYLTRNTLHLKRVTRSSNTATQLLFMPRVLRKRRKLASTLTPARSSTILKKEPTLSEKQLLIKRVFPRINKMNTESRNNSSTNVELSEGHMKSQGGLVLPGRTQSENNRLQCSGIIKVYKRQILNAETLFE